MMTDFTIIVTALDETWSARKTVETLMQDNAANIGKIIFATAPHATPECRATIAALQSEHPQQVHEHVQSRLPGVGGAMRECLEFVETPWVILMAADLETPPETVKNLIAAAQKDDVDIIATSRWMSGGSLGNYNKIKLILNWIFQKVFAVLYACSLTDMTYGFRAHRTQTLTAYNWQETGHALFMEIICVSLRAKLRVVEIPAQWARRQEGQSHILVSEFARYFLVGFRARVRSPQHWKKQETTNE